MSFSWSEYLDTATHLVQYGATSGFEEACLRSAISRAYHAALNTAMNFLRDQWGADDLPQDATVHQAVPPRFRSEGQQEIATLLDRLRDRRRRADYGDAIGRARPLAEAAVADGNRVLERLSGL